MRKLFGAFFVVLLLASASLAAITYPVQSAISPKDMFPGETGYQGYLYILDTMSGSSRLLIKKVYSDTTAPSSVTTISLPGTPFGVAVSPDGEKVYISVSGSTQSIKIYNKDGSVPSLSTFPSSSFRGLRGVAISPDGKRLYVADSIAHAVHIIDTATGTLITSINVPVASDVYSVAVSGDNTLLAVTQKTTTGRLYVYRMDYGADGQISGYTQIYSVTSLRYPNYPVFSPDSKRLYVRVHEISGSYVDVKIYNAGPNTTDWSLLANVTAIAGADTLTINDRGGEALTLSSNGQYMYFSHYNATLNKIQYYRIGNVDSLGNPRTDYSVIPSSSYGDSMIREIDALTPYDGLTASPDGSRLWATCSEGGAYFNIRYTGFTTYPGGVLINAIPGAPDIIHPESPPDDLANITGEAVWAAGADDDDEPGYRFEVQYRAVDETDWVTLLGFNHFYSTSLTSLARGTWYILRVRMYDDCDPGEEVTDPDGGRWSAYAYSQPFRKPKPQIDTVELDTNWDPTPGAETWQVYDQNNNIGYIYETVRINGSGFGAVSNPWYNGDGTSNKIILRSYITGPYGTFPVDSVIPGYEDKNGNGTMDEGEMRIFNWENNLISLQIPRKFKDGTYLSPGYYDLIVRAFGVDSVQYSFKVGPVITDMQPVTGPVGKRVYIYGAGFDAIKGSDDKIYFYNGREASIYSWTSREAGSDHLVCWVPSGAETGRMKVTMNNVDSAVNYMGNPHTTYNEPVIFTVTPGSQPSTFHLITPPNLATNISRRAGFDWENATDPDGSGAVDYTLQISNASSFATLVREKTGLTTSDHTLSEADMLAASRTYYWRVIAKDSDGSERFSAETWRFTTGTSTTPATAAAAVIDDFEGGSVNPTTGYYGFGTPPPTYARITTDKYEGSNSMQTSYVIADAGYRGWGGTLITAQNLTSYDTISFRVKRSTTDATDNKIKIQFKDADGTNVTISDTDAFLLADIPADRWVERKVQMSRISTVLAAGTTPGMDWGHTTDYQFDFTGVSASPGNILIDYVTATSEALGPGSISFTLYHLDTGNENWIATPFIIAPECDTTVELGNAIANTAPGALSNITIKKWDNSGQTFTTTSGDYVDGGWIWDPVDGYPITAGEMFKVNVTSASAPPFSTTLNLSGDVPGLSTVQFDLYHLDIGNENWMSIPYNRSDIINTVLLADPPITSSFVPGDGDNITIRKWDNSAQTFTTTSGDRVGGWAWDPTTGYPSNNGYPYMIFISRAAGPPFNTRTTF
jgi:YVTN family beta-propeller protein